MLTKEELNEQLEKLLNPDLEHTERQEILQGVRTGYGELHSQYEATTDLSTKLQKEKDDLIVANSQLFRQTGVVGNPEKTKEEETKNFSETITVSAIEKGLV